MDKSINLVGTGCTDAVKWAEEFMAIFKDRKDDIDTELMITWFANAIEVAKDSVSYESKFKEQYLGNWDTNYEKVNTCGDCLDFGPNGCMTSGLEAKYGSKSTPACSEFKERRYNGN